MRLSALGRREAVAVAAAAVAIVIAAIGAGMITHSIQVGGPGRPSSKQLPGSPSALSVIPNGTVTTVAIGGFVTWSFNLTQAGILSGRVIDTGDWNLTSFQLYNASEYAQLIASNTNGSMRANATAYYILSGSPAIGSLSLQTQLPAGEWHLGFLNPELPSEPPPQPCGAGCFPQPGGSTQSLYWIGGLWVY